MAEHKAPEYDEQQLWLAQASKNVKKCAFYLRKAIVSAPRSPRDRAP
jgi:hypothetical protein